MCGFGNRKNKGKVAVALLGALCFNGGGALAANVPNKSSGIVGKVLAASLGVGIGAGAGAGVLGTLMVQKLLGKNESSKDGLENKNLKNKNLEDKDLVNEVALPEIDEATGVIKLDSVKNIRFLGWKMKDKNGNLINDKAFIRSGNTNELTPQDLAKLKKLGVKTVIDLRFHEEIYGNSTKKPSFDKFINNSDVWYQNIAIPLAAKNDTCDQYNSMYNVYCEALGYNLSNSNWDKLIGQYPRYFGPNQIKGIFECIAESPKEGKILFHCTHGKDRTGILAALLLYIAGVNIDTIVQNFVDCYNKKGSSVAKNFTGGVMHNIINGLASEWGNIENYLTNCCRIKPEIIQKVKQRLNPKAFGELTDDVKK